MAVIKRRNIVIISALLLTVFTFIMCFAALYKNPAGVNGTGITVVLDAGHGGIDGGVSGIKTGVKESEINLAVVKKLAEYFSDAGINAVLTRKSDAGLYGVASSTLKRRDMEKRRDIINAAKPTLVISVHMNYYASSDRRGGQVFFKSGSESGEILAKNIQKHLNSLYRDVKDYSPLSGDYYIINCTDYPTVIAECGFLSNPQDESLLITQEFREELSYALFCGAINYLTEQSIAYF